MTALDRTALRDFARLIAVEIKHFFCYKESAFLIHFQYNDNNNNNSNSNKKHS